MIVNRQVEKTAEAWAWRAMIGPAQILDGLLNTLTLGTVSAGAASYVAKRNAMARIEGIRRQKGA